MDHANTLSAAAIMPGFEEHTTFGNRPTGIVIPRFRNLDKLDGDGFTRGYSFQGGALQSTWTAGTREAGIGAEYKNHLREPGAWRMVLVVFAESVPRVTNRLALSKSSIRWACLSWRSASTTARKKWPLWPMPRRRPRPC
jgi:hypothetical protein